MYLFLLETETCIVSVTGLTSGYIDMFMDLKTNTCIYIVTYNVKVRSAALFTLNAELGVEETFPNS